METKNKRGFGAMDPKKQLEIASKGGKSAHASGTAHKFTKEEARAAGRKGGTAISQNREHMARIGALGGLAKRKTTAAIILLVILFSAAPASACRYDWECNQQCISSGGNGVCVKEGPFTYNPASGICICIRGQQ